jgi:hypothetical protein
MRVHSILHNGSQLAEVADFVTVKFQLKNKYDAKRKYEYTRKLTISQNTC